jgi:glycosyltransferase involved in cell wall biosynthesis
MRVLQVITRLNLGGPTDHVVWLDRALRERGHESRVVCGRVGGGEAQANRMLAASGTGPIVLPTLGPAVAPGADASAFVALARIIRRLRPDVVHTHTSKAGALGRLGATAALRPPPTRVHTFHGHVLEEYYSECVSEVLQRTERALTRVTDGLVCVAEATRADLLRLGLAPPEKVFVIPLAFDPAPFEAVADKDVAAFRHAAGAGPETVLAVFTGRLVGIKRVDRMVRALAAARAAGAPVVLAIVGDGPERGALEAEAARLGVAPITRFLGYREDMPAVAAGADIALLTSDNEGTPVWLLEAAASRTPSIATRVGGVPEVVGDGAVLVEPEAEEELAAALVALASDSRLRAELGRRAFEHVRECFDARRRTDEIEALYQSLGELRW